jgi:pimeloyl-ACP methyl ester carboxylesterase
MEKKFLMLLVALGLFIGIGTETVRGENISADRTISLTSNESGFVTRELLTSRDGLTIFGIAYIPANIQGKVPTVIMSHGFGGNYTYNETHAESLARAGIASYVFDFAGGSQNSRSDGKTTDMSVLTEIADLNAVLDFIKAQDFADADNLFLMGKSQGGIVSALVAAQRPYDVQGLILIYPAFVIPDDAKKRFSSIDEIPQQMEYLFNMTIGKVYFADVFDLDLYAAIPAYTKDVLFIHGDKDSLVPLSYSERAVQVYKSAELIVLEGAGHGLTGEYADRASDEMLSYIVRHVQDAQVEF